MATVTREDWKLIVETFYQHAPEPGRTELIELKLAEYDNLVASVKPRVQEPQIVKDMQARLDSQPKRFTLT